MLMNVEKMTPLASRDERIPLVLILKRTIRGVLAMEQSRHSIPEERARLTEIQDSLIDRYVEQKEALEEGNRCRAIEIQFEIKELLEEKRNLSSGRRW
jgi:hypothetical protein